MKFLSLLFIPLFVLSVVGQSPDRWRELVIDDATPERAIEKFGKPGSDKIGPRLFLNNRKWFAKDAIDTMRVLHYENIEGFKDVKLGFREDRLVLIHLEPKKLTAQAFVAAYPELDFRYGNEVQSPADFARPRVNSDRPYKAGVVYLLVSVAEKSIVLGQCGNATGSVMSDLFGGSHTRNSGRTLPGDVMVIQLVSRKLENRDGVDLLR